MTVLNTAINRIKNLSNFKVELKESIPGDPTSAIIHVSEFPYYDYEKNVIKIINQLHKAFDEIASSPNREAALVQLKILIDQIKSLSWDSKVLRADLYYEDKESEKIIYSLYGEELLAAHTIYSELKNSIVSDLFDVLIRQGYSWKGIGLNVEASKVGECYDFLIQNNLVEKGKRELFIDSLTGGDILGDVRWKDGATLARFIDGCSKSGIKGDCFSLPKQKNQDGPTKDWKKVLTVFKCDFKGKRLTENIKSNISSKPHDNDPIIEKAISFLK